MAENLTLYTFAVSHFSEKIRWTLDLSGLPYREQRLTPFFHVLHNRRLTRGRSTSVPILRSGEGKVIADSTRILEWLAREHPAAVVENGLIPAAPALNKQVMEIEERFDRVGSHVIRYLYSFALDYPDEVLDLWGVDATRVQRGMLRLSYPLLRTAFRKGLRITDANARRSKAIIGESLDWLEHELADGREFLAGPRLTVADITACALLAPLAAPIEHPLYCLERYRSRVAEHLGDWMERPALEWVRRTYAHWRYPARARAGAKAGGRKRTRRMQRRGRASSR
jgi:glutathione S-transferase